MIWRGLSASGAGTVSDTVSLLYSIYILCISPPGPMPVLPCRSLHFKEDSLYCCLLKAHGYGTQVAAIVTRLHMSHVLLMHASHSVILNY